MTSHIQRFNSYFLWVLLALAVGCSSPGGDKTKSSDSKSTSKSKARKEYALFRLHLQVNADGTSFTMPVSVYRARPVTLVVNTTPVVSEVNIARAELVDDLAGYSIMVMLDRQGALALENATTAFKDSRLVVFSQWGGEKNSEGRWLGAVYIDKRLSDGIFTFTPDASREEAERIVAGMNNVAERLRKNTLQ